MGCKFTEEGNEEIGSNEERYCNNEEDVKWADNRIADICSEVWECRVKQRKSG